MDRFQQIVTTAALAFAFLMPAFNYAQNPGRVRVLAGLAMGAIIASAYAQEYGLPFVVAPWLMGY